MSIKLFDSHAHYYDARFRDETTEGADNILAALFASDVSHIINVGTNNQNHPECLAQAMRHEGMYAALGIHPGDCRDYDKSEFDVFREFLLAHRDFKANKIVAIGEIGLDYYWDKEPEVQERQRYWFGRQIDLAKEEGVSHVAITYALQRAVKKLKKFLQ